MIVNIAALRSLEKDGLLTCRKHPTDDFLIWNYTRKVQYERVWNEHTLMCRGLITDPSGTIIARPFPKFFNADEWVAMGNTIPVEPFEVTEKLDGSLGILYCSSRGWEIATRGSFDSPQARLATAMIPTCCGKGYFPSGLTYLFEIIHSENRIVVDYGERKELVLLAVIDTETGKELPVENFNWKAARRYDVTEFNAIKAMGGANEEGFVVRFRSGLRLKIKLDEYIRLHRLLTGLTPRAIWEVLSAGSSLESFRANVPEEFAAWLDATAAEIRGRFDVIMESCQRQFRHVPREVSRKEQADVIKDMFYPHVLFQMLDGKDPAPAVWKLVYPGAAATFRCDDGG